MFGMLAHSYNFLLGLIESLLVVFVHGFLQEFEQGGRVQDVVQHLFIFSNALISLPILTRDNELLL